MILLSAAVPKAKAVVNAAGLVAVAAALRMASIGSLLCGVGGVRIFVEIAKTRWPINSILVSYHKLVVEYNYCGKF